MDAATPPLAPLSGGAAAARLGIVHIVAPALVGGLERVVRALAGGQRDAGHDVRVVAVVNPDEADDHPFARSLTAEGIAVTTLPIGPREYRRERLAIQQLLERTDPDIVHTHGYRPDVLDAGVARRLGIAVVSTVHGFTGGDVKNRLYEWLQLRAYRRFQAVVAVSPPLAAQLRQAGVPAERIHCLPNGWKPEVPLERTAAQHALGVADGGFRIGFVGRLSHEKGADVLLQALALVGDRSVTASIIGEGPEAGVLRQLTSDLGIDDRVTFHGTIDDAHLYFRAFDAFVLSSRTEGTPITLLEAMGAQVPVAVTRVGGVPHVVGDAEALLVPPEDPAALADAIQQLRDLPLEGRRRALRALERLHEEFSASRWLRRYEAVYRAATSTHTNDFPR